MAGKRHHSRIGLVVARTALFCVAMLVLLVGSVPKATPTDLPLEATATPAPTPTAQQVSDERLEARMEMVERQIRRRGVTDQDVLDAMERVSRHEFVPPQHQSRAYADHPLPIGYGQTISQPYIVGYMTELLELDEESKVLEIGTGSGYQAAVAAELAGQVYSIEIIKALGESGRQRLKELGYKNVQVEVADGYYGWPEKGPFEAIIVTASSSHIPEPLIEQLKPGGRLVIPLGSAWRAQELVLVSKGADGTLQSRGVMGVRFVPMVGKAQE